MIETNTPVKGIDNKFHIIKQVTTIKAMNTTKNVFDKTGAQCAVTPQLCKATGGKSRSN